MLPIQLNLREVDLDLVGMQAGITDIAEIENIEDGAVFRGRQIEIVHRRETSGARHVLHHHGQVARDVAAPI